MSTRGAKRKCQREEGEHLRACRVQSQSVSHTTLCKVQWNETGKADSVNVLVFGRNQEHRSMLTYLLSWSADGTFMRTLPDGHIANQFPFSYFAVCFAPIFTTVSVAQQSREETDGDTDARRTANCSGLSGRLSHYSHSHSVYRRSVKWEGRGLFWLPRKLHSSYPAVESASEAPNFNARLCTVFFAPATCAPSSVHRSVA